MRKRFILILAIFALTACTPASEDGKPKASEVVLTLPVLIVTPSPSPEPFTSCEEVTEIPPIECEALVAIYTHNEDEFPQDNNWWLRSNTPCAWRGVVCVDNHVVQLFLVGNNLSDLPPEMVNLTSLATLALGDNNISSLPLVIPELTSLTRLYLDNNQLSHIPPEIGNLTNLTELSFANNQLSSVPAELSHLKSLESFDLHGTPLSNVPPEICDSLGGVIQPPSLCPP